MLLPVLLACSIPQDVVFEDHSTPAPGGVTLEGRLGRFEVPLDHADPDGPTLTLAFVHFASTNPDPGPPIVYLAGGPGGSGIETCVGPAAGRTLALLDHGDVIGLDQRGTGRSEPFFADGPTFAVDLPTDRVPTRAEREAAWRRVTAEAADHWRAAGYPLEHFTTTQSAADVDALRRALGLEQVVLYGQSYGAHLGLEVLRNHADGVARAVLGKVEGPDHTYKLPSTTQRFLEQLGDLVRADPGVAEALPDLTGTVAELLERLEREPVTAEVERDGATVELRLGPDDLRGWLANCLGEAFDLRAVPATLVACARGDWTAVAEFALFERRVEVWSPMAIAMDCASGASPARLRRLLRERDDPRYLLSDAVNGPFPALCGTSGVEPLERAFRAERACEVPVLFVSGTLDARTPPSNVEELIGWFPAAAHVVCENGTHEPLEVLSPDFVQLARRFLDGEEVESATIALPPPRFLPAE